MLNRLSRKAVVLMLRWRLRIRLRLRLLVVGLMVLIVLRRERSLRPAVDGIRVRRVTIRIGRRRITIAHTRWLITTRVGSSMTWLRRRPSDSALLGRPIPTSSLGRRRRRIPAQVLSGDPDSRQSTCNRAAEC